MTTMQPTRHLITTLALAGTMLSAHAATPPATAPDQAEELAKKLNNPVADLISVPFQNNLPFTADSMHIKSCAGTVK